ncbi:MAG: flippase-like domain-containing protein [Pseudomonadales bacterium]|nr:flippase-like domain-containing protein [Pseudomonadales bacterium]
MQKLKHVCIATIVIGVFLYLGYQIESHWDQLSAIDYLSSWKSLLAHVLALILMQTLMVIGWHNLLRRHQIHLTKQQLIYSYFVPALGKYLPGKVLFLAGRVELIKKFGGSRSAGFSVFILENIFLLLAASFFVLPSLFAFFKLPGQWLGAAYLAPCLAAIWIVIKPNTLFKYFNLILQRLRRQPLTIHIKSMDALLILSIYLLIWFAYGLGCAFFALEISNTSYDHLFIVASAFVLAWMAGFLSIITPGGLGVREAIIVVLLSPILGEAIAALMAVMMRLTWTIIELTISAGALSLITNRENGTKTT